MVRRMHFAISKKLMHAQNKQASQQVKYVLW
jgi:hypothetical protein